MNLFGDFKSEIRLSLIVTVVAVILAVAGIWLFKTMQPSPVLPQPVTEQTSPPAPSPQGQTSETSEIKVGKVEIDYSAISTTQKLVDEGHQPWQLNPILVLRSEMASFGFDPDKDFGSIDTPDTSTQQKFGTEITAFPIEVDHNDKTYIVTFIQPIPGPGKIWTTSLVCSSTKVDGYSYQIPETAKHYSAGFNGEIKVDLDGDGQEEIVRAYVGEKGWLDGEPGSKDVGSAVPPGKPVIVKVFSGGGDCPKEVLSSKGEENLIAGLHKLLNF